MCSSRLPIRVSFGGTAIEFEDVSGLTVAELHGLLQESGIGDAGFDLSYAGQVLQEGRRRISSFHVRAGATMYLVRRSRRSSAALQEPVPSTPLPEPPIECDLTPQPPVLRVRTSFGETFDFPHYLDLSVSALRAEVASRCEVPERHVRLFATGRELTDCDDLQDLTSKNGICLVQTVFRRSSAESAWGAIRRHQESEGGFADIRAREAARLQQIGNCTFPLNGSSNTIAELLQHLPAGSNIRRRRSSFRSLSSM